MALPACDAKIKAGTFAEDKAQALTSVEKFRAFYEKQNYDRLYEMGAPAMKAAVSKEQFLQAVQSTNVKYGRYKSSVLVGSSCFPNEVRLVYDAKYEKANVREFMVWSVPESDAQLVMYQIGTGQDDFDKRTQQGCPTP